MHDDPSLRPEEITVKHVLLWLFAVALWLVLFPVYYGPALLYSWIRGREVRVWMFTGY
ncbi:hypothetical protein SAMN05444159_0381 [Bradyrhizobium lablabi]|uniref:Uncharacterized protein n=1 Tax=Bradyrhizobium lablabi TaxID=722472 RepID=A0A1M6IJT6_9BRAD|nr:hypothetical protein SAMN05444159_0381 [Bradyrhizobium lablabi]